MLVSLLAALDQNRVIGSTAGKLPWDLPRDREHFRARTEGRWLLAGRRTYSEMEGWFGTRVPLVLTRDASFETFEPSHRLVSSPAEAVALANANGEEELVVIGGGAVFEATMTLADQLLLTRIDLEADVAEPVYFPEFEESGEWSLAHAEDWPGENGAPDARYEVHVRVNE